MVKEDVLNGLAQAARCAAQHATDIRLQLYHMGVGNVPMNITLGAPPRILFMKPALTRIAV